MPEATALVFSYSWPRDLTFTEERRRQLAAETKLRDKARTEALVQAEWERLWAVSRAGKQGTSVV